MSSMDLQGVVIPLVTPFTDDLSQVSEVRLARLVRSLIPQNPGGFLVGGDLGEFAFLSLSERKAVLEIVLRETSNAVPVVVNVSAVGTMAALDLAQHAKRHGAKASVVMPPYYGQFTSQEMLHHLKMIANYSDNMVLVVDPQGRLDAQVAADLTHNASVRFPAPAATKVGANHAISESSTTDEFAVADCLASPVALFELRSISDAMSGAEAKRAAIMANAMRTNGKVRLAKALLQYRDIETGPPRNPYQMSSIDVVRALEAELA